MQGAMKIDELKWDSLRFAIDCFAKIRSAHCPLSAFGYNRRIP
jgi:hypothetical protein